MFDWPDLILKTLPMAENAIAPGKFKELKKRVTCHALFHDIRKNHHLKRALRLSWISAAHAVVHACEEDMRDCGDRELLADFRRFLPVFHGAMNQIREQACNLSSKNDLPDSLIDDFVCHFVDSMPEHLAFNTGDEGKQYVTERFLDDLHRITGTPEPLPQALVSRAQLGVVTGTGRARSFGTLMFDDFAGVLQDPAAYPEATVSFLQIQHGIHKQLSQENLVISRRLVDLVTDVDRQLGELLQQDPSSWIKPLNGRFDDLSILVTGVDDRVKHLSDQLSGWIEEQRTQPLALRGSFGDANVRADPQAGPRDNGWDDPLMQPPTLDHARIIHYGLFEGPGRFRPISHAFRRILENMGFSDAVELRPWHVPTIEQSLRQSERYFQDAEAHWAERHCATIIEIGPTLGASIPPDHELVDKVDARRWSEPDAPGVDLELGDKMTERSRAARTGSFPLTVETRLALSTLMSGRHLRLLLRGPRDKVSQSVEVFLKFMEARGVPVESAEVLDKGKSWVLRFLQALLGITPSYIENPYPRLEHYALEDAARYHGRADECDAALALLARRRQQGQPAVLGVRGPSGCGKSSFVQARLVAAMVGQGQRALTLRRTDLLGEDGESVKAPRLLIEKLRVALGQSEGDGPATLYEGDPAFVVPSCRHHLDKLLKQAGDPRVVLCIDQFEEIVDDLADRRSVPEWQALLSLIDHLAAMPRLTIVFTLEDSRQGRLADVCGDHVVGDPAWLDLDDAEPAFLRTIVQTPLREAGFELEPEIADRLVTEAIELSRTNGDIGSPLPLLSLKMHNLFREMRARGLEGNVDAPVLVNAHVLAGLSLSISEEIEALAEEAWRRADAQESDLGHFLRPLVRLSKSVTESGKTNIVLGTVKARKFSTDRRVEKAFIKLRLLVPAPSGWRLVHESVLHRWKRSADWFAATKDELSREAALRRDAQAWHEQGRPTISTPAPDQLDAAVLTLSAQIRNWATDQPITLTDEERHLRDFALALFDRSDTPMALVPSSPLGSLHIHLAASYGRVELLRRFVLLDESALHATTREGRTPLHCAAFTQAAATAFLLRHGADVRQLQDDGSGALEIATWVQREDILDLLLATLAQSSPAGLPGTPLLSAAQTGNLDLVRKLEAAGYSHATVGENGWTALHCAAIHDHLDCFRYFLRRGDLEAKNNEGLTAIDVAAANGHWTLIQAAFSHEATGRILRGDRGADWTTLSLAADRKRSKTVEMLVPLCDPNAVLKIPGEVEGYTALHVALREYDKDRESASQRLRRQTALTVEALLSSPQTDVLIRAKGKGVLEMATGLPRLQAAIQAHPSFDPLRPMENGWNELMLAAKSGDRQRVLGLFELIKTREHIDHVSEDGVSLALLMLQAGMADLVEPLLRSGEVDPWREARGYAGLLVASDTPATRPLFKTILAAMPDRLSPYVASRVLSSLIARDSARDGDEALARRVLSRTDLTDGAYPLARLMIGAVQLGRLDMFLLLEAQGLTPPLPDVWGRGIEDLASDLTREALRNRHRVLS